MFKKFPHKNLLCEFCLTVCSTDEISHGYTHSYHQNVYCNVEVLHHGQSVCALAVTVAVSVTYLFLSVSGTHRLFRAVSQVSTKTHVRPTYKQFRPQTGITADFTPPSNWVYGTPLRWLLHFYFFDESQLVITVIL